MPSSNMNYSTRFHVHIYVFWIRFECSRQISSNFKRWYPIGDKVLGTVGIVGLHGRHCCSHRLELMRQIYNMNESLCPEDEELPPPLVLAPPPAVLAQQQQQDILQCISACAQQTRLSLANLLPSRFVPPRWYAAARNKLVGLFLSRRLCFTRVRAESLLALRGGLFGLATSAVI